MITGYGGYFGESDNQGYYVGAEAVDFQYPVSFLSWSLVGHDDMMIVLLFSLLVWLTFYL